MRLEAQDNVEGEDFKRSDEMTIKKRNEEFQTQTRVNEVHEE